MTRSWPQAVQHTLGAVISTLLRLLVLALGALLGLAVLALGVLLTLGLVIWALVRGRKPVLQARHFRWRGRAGAPARPAEVVDIEAHEVRESTGAAVPPAILIERER